ncbi:50S ribosomal protein L40e [Candidatus Woesearchaeota archaeon]|nr:50S ribosomal protein L40e [Candidatus Woesearchaeota archaeon]
MAKFPEAETRIFKNVFICRKCKNKVRAPNMKVLSGKVKCRSCNSKSLRTVRKK